MTDETEAPRLDQNRQTMPRVRGVASGDWGHSEGKESEEEMTIAKLKKLIDAAIESGTSPRTPVCVDKSTLWDGNGTFDICDVSVAEVYCISVVDGDGFHEELADGSEKLRMCFVLSNQ